ncbi:hypothetical protein ADUPG1_008082 [Aduncisulcus paluster]|uniref:non-specific serine/threonine protein kinase n=1 Tax=Aduncisulcus paluster TaxID=2918883 RepID=A0ABQ5KTP5_9EUKA|nr:hypothetical protein ADUPG1_008082 [Aduncisulcus paluster]
MGIWSAFLKQGCNPGLYPPGKEPKGKKPPKLIASHNVVRISPLGLNNAELNFVKGTGGIRLLGTLPLKFDTCSNVREIYMNVHNFSGPKQLIITFEHSDGISKTQLTYDFVRPTSEFEWHLLRVDRLENVISCRIESKGGSWNGIDARPSIFGIRIMCFTKKPSVLLKECQSDLKERESTIIELQAKISQMFEDQSDLVKDFQSELTRRDSTITELQTKISDLDSRLSAYQQSNEREYLVMARKYDSLQEEISIVSDRQAGATISVNSSVQALYDSTVKHRDFVLSCITKLADITDESKCTSASIIASISPSLWCDSEFGSSSSSSSPVTYILSFLRSLQYDSSFQSSHSEPSSSSSPSPLDILNGMHRSIHSMVNFIDESSSSHRDLSSITPIPSPHGIVSEILSPIPDNPCSKTLNDRVKSLKSLCNLVTSNMTSGNVPPIVRTGKQCISHLMLFLSHIVDVTVTDVDDSLSSQALLNTCDHVSDAITKCLRRFEKSEHDFNGCLSQYELIRKQSESCAERIGDLSMSTMHDDSWVLDAATEITQIFQKLKDEEIPAIPLEEKQDESSTDEVMAISSNFLTSVLVSNAIDSESPKPKAKAISSMLPEFSPFSSYKKTHSMIDNELDRLDESSLSLFHSKYSSSMDSLDESIDILASSLCSHILSSLEQQFETDSALTSLKARVSGHSHKTGSVMLADLNDGMKDQCKHEAETFSSLLNVLNVDSGYVHTCESFESAIVSVVNSLCSILDVCTKYMHIIVDYYRALLFCLLRMCELCGWRNSVGNIEGSEDEIEKIRSEMQELRKLMKGKQMKKGVLIHVIESQKEKLTHLQDRSKSSGTTSSKFGLDDEDSEDECEENVELLTKTLDNNEKKLERIAKNISTICSEMNKRYLRCIELQKHASALSSVGFSIPPCLDESLILSYPCVNEGGTDCDDQDEGDADRMGIRRSFGKDEGALPLIFSTGVALGMFSDIQEIRSSGGSDTMSKDRFLHEGNVFSARWQLNDTTRDVVLKFIDIPNDGTVGSSDISPTHYRTLLRSAFSARTGSDCPYIISLLSVFYDEHVLTPSKTGAYLVFPFYSNGDMNYWLKKAPRSISSVRLVLKSILHALVHLHRNGIVHCDLKPQNVLIDSDGHGVLCDFEAAVDSSNRMIGILSQTMRVGTPGFIAPELQKSMARHQHPHPSPASDIYSFGILLKDVFKTMSEYGPSPIEMPSEICAIIDSCLSEDPTDRPMATDLLANKWFM